MFDSNLDLSVWQLDLQIKAVNDEFSELLPKNGLRIPRPVAARCTHDDTIPMVLIDRQPSLESTTADFRFGYLKHSIVVFDFYLDFGLIGTPAVAACDSP